MFRVDPAKVPSAGVRARCSVCGAVMPVEHPPVAAASPVGAPATASVEAAVLTTEAHAAPERIESGTRVPVATPVPAPRQVSRAPDVPKATPEPTAAPKRRAETPTSTVPAAPARASEVPPAPPAERARPFNPYLNNTPELRARRLARALVSDLVAYNPQKREEGLRDGTLRQLFREEIRKSWDEYVEQVGADVAESTPHFQDALNDVLAGGRRVF